MLPSAFLCTKASPCAYAANKRRGLFEVGLRAAHMARPRWAVLRLSLRQQDNETGKQPGDGRSIALFHEENNSSFFLWYQNHHSLLRVKRLPSWRK